MYLVNFQILRPEFEGAQEHLLSWLTSAHTFNEENDRKIATRNVIQKVACSKSHIRKRGHSLADYHYSSFDAMPLFNLAESPHGPGFRKRMESYNAIVDPVFEKFYPEQESSPPSDIIHVTCTGYVSPSSAQKIVARKAWLRGVTVTHAYHMGCMAAIPAMRMARGFAKQSQTLVDIVHTEICSLHMNPSLNTPSQIIAESLFADGFIKYSMTPHPEKECFALLALHEQILPDSEKLMEWVCEDWGMRMTLSKEIPHRIAAVLSNFVKDLLIQAGLKPEHEQVFFAIHPGGPKIVDLVAETLKLKEESIVETREILAEYGNMSSGTLPHILERMLPRLKKESIVIGLAFGPGLTLAGVVLKKV